MRESPGERASNANQIAMITNENDQPVHRFILQAIDPALGCPVLEALFRVADVEMLRPLLGADASTDAELRWRYMLDPATLRAVTERFEVAFDPKDRECWLSRVHAIGDVPYLIHTGYELLLMLDGVKPFAIFAVEYPVEPDDFQEDALFEPHVLSDLLVKRVVDKPFDKPIRSSSGRIYDGVRQVFYARRGEEWRIDAYILLWRQLDHGPWNETLERLLGSLLGYTDKQNDWWLGRRRKNNASAAYTDRTAYIAVDAAELAWIRAVGERALKPERSEASLELVMHMPRPGPAILQRWLAASDAAAIIRVGLPRNFFTGREVGQRDDAQCYTIKPAEVLALNRALTSSIEVVAERQGIPIAKQTAIEGQNAHLVTLSAAFRDGSGPSPLPRG